jgi:hypothetical protein
MTATLDAMPLALTTFEFELLRVLTERRLRKLSDDPRKPRRLKTVRGVGYVLTQDER